MTQTEQIRAHLIEHNSIDSREALEKYHCMRLAARVKDLRRQGFSVVTVMIKRNGCRFARYVMG
jgi:hypothetical protein